MIKHCWVQNVACVWPPCCDMLQQDGCWWFKLEKSQIFHVTFVDVAWCFTCLDRLVRQCCVNQGMHTSSICNTQLVTTGWPNMCNMPPQQHWGMLQLFGWVYKHWANNAVTFFLKMLQSLIWPDLTYQLKRRISHSTGSYPRTHSSP